MVLSPLCRGSHRKLFPARALAGPTRLALAPSREPSEQTLGHWPFEPHPFLPPLADLRGRTRCYTWCLWAFSDGIKDDFQKLPAFPSASLCPSSSELQRQAGFDGEPHLPGCVLLTREKLHGREVWGWVRGPRCPQTQSMPADSQQHCLLVKINWLNGGSCLGPCRRQSSLHGHAESTTPKIAPRDPQWCADTLAVARTVGHNLEPEKGFYLTSACRPLTPTCLLIRGWPRGWLKSPPPPPSTGKIQGLRLNDLSQGTTPWRVNFQGFIWERG